MEAEYIVNKIIEHREINRDLLYSKFRRADIVMCRKLISFFLRKHTTLNLKQIAKFAGVTDHSTAIFHIEDIYDKLSVDKSIQNLIYEIECFLQGVQLDSYQQIKDTILEYFNLTDFSLNVIKKTRAIYVCQSFIAYFLHKYHCDMDKIYYLAKLKGFNEYQRQRNVLILDLQSVPQIKQHEHILSMIISDFTQKIENGNPTKERTDYRLMSAV